MADEATTNDLEARVAALESKLTTKQSTKQAVAEIIADVFENREGVATVITNSNHTGPLGGKSEQVNVIFDDGEGNISGVIINVYKDTNTEQSINKLLDEAAKKAELAEKVTKLPKRVQGTKSNDSDKGEFDLNAMMPTPSKRLPRDIDPVRW